MQVLRASPTRKCCAQVLRASAARTFHAQVLRASPTRKSHNRVGSFDRSAACYICARLPTLPTGADIRRRARGQGERVAKASSECCMQRVLRAASAKAQFVPR